MWHCAPGPTPQGAVCWLSREGSTLPRAELRGGFVRYHTACHPSITLCLTGHLGGCAQQGCEQPQGWGSPTRGTPVSPVKAAGRMQGRQEVSELQGTGMGGDQRAVEAWVRERDCAFLCCSEPGVQLEPGRRARSSAWSHTCTAREVVSAHLHESSHQTPTEHSLQAS